MQTLLLYLFYFFLQVCGRNHGNAAMLPRRRVCAASPYGIRKKRNKMFPTRFSADSTFILGRFLANVSSLVLRPGDVGRVPRILAQYFKPRRTLCFGSSDQLDSAASFAFISGSKVVADGQSLDRNTHVFCQSEASVRHRQEQHLCGLLVLRVIWISWLSWF